MVREDSWYGRLVGLREERDVLRLVSWLPQDPGEGGSSPLLALATDGNQYWVKLTTSQQGPMVPVNEQIVGRCGALIGAASCLVRLVEIPPSLAGEVSGIHVQPGLAHGSLDVPATVNERKLGHRYDDDNPRRHVGILALHDWCWGRDSQWLFALTDDHKTYSHDHGHYFPDGPDWQMSLDLLRARVDEPHPLHSYFTPAGLDPTAIGARAAALDDVTAQDLVRILSGIPVSWPVSDSALEFVGFFLERRASQVADRLRSLIA